MNKQSCEQMQWEIFSSDTPLAHPVVEHCRTCDACRATAETWQKWRTVRADHAEPSPALDLAIKLAARRQCGKYHTMTIRPLAWAAALALTFGLLTLALQIFHPVGDPTDKIDQLSQEEYLANWDWSSFEQESLSVDTNLQLSQLAYGE